MIYKQSEVNFHTHTFYSHHGSGTVKEYVEKAKEIKRLKVLGFSEHTILPFPFIPSERMSRKENEEYIKEVREYEIDKDILVLLGGECDWRADLYSFYKDELLSKYGFDYLLGSIHYLKSTTSGELFYLGEREKGRPSLREYVDSYTSMLSSSLFLYGCHPDLYMATRDEWGRDEEEAAKDIISCAKENNIALEINANGLLKKQIERKNGIFTAPYPVEEFWYLAKDSGIKIVSGSDAHSVKNLDNYDKVLDFVSPFSLAFSSFSIEGRRIEII